ncbi:ethanolamine ammonia-lyase light chain [Ilumatobacter fluminis]|uniref:Ethanolamine ammonia-lyase small subunit n=1 Tax=Ilumatobacter fluminis TaxID=467091 RepID=A0A4R7I0A6_9ACTN|nr:ethanolamine ammonia-lyase subunit EutC [Ilumatobacter fluminis]TDT15863.1 ethanolamine ammonia-lyase light chain [Ilumatobacter fluminis]
MSAPDDDRDRLEPADRPAIVTNDPWRRLDRFTDARIGLGRAGVSLPTNRTLEFQLAHARAKDAVHLPLDADALVDRLAGIEPTVNRPIRRLHSMAVDRTSYLQRPDLGRRLDAASRDALMAIGAPAASLAIVVVDGLSSLAVQQHAAPMVDALVGLLADAGSDPNAHGSWTLAPVCIVEQGRVAIGDEVGALLDARAVVVLIGERPGLSSPDSLGIYLTWGPRVGLSDANRNCISNIRPGGLDFGTAAERLLHLLVGARHLGRTGVDLKDRSGDEPLSSGPGIGNFLIS